MSDRPRASRWSLPGHALGHPVTGAICRLLLGGVFLYTAVPKLMHPAEFARLVNGYRVLHPDLVNLAGITLPWMELAAGALLVLGLLPQSAALVAGGLLSAFIVGGFLALVRGLQIECGCFFPFMGGSKLSWALFPRDLGMLLLALQVIAWPSSWRVPFAPSALAEDVDEMPREAQPG